MSEQDEPRFSGGDLAHITEEYLTLEQLCADRAQTLDEVRELIAKGDLPRPTYEFHAGTGPRPAPVHRLRPATLGSHRPRQPHHGGAREIPRRSVAPPPHVDRVVHLEPNV